MLVPYVKLKIYEHINRTDIVCSLTLARLGNEDKQWEKERKIYDANENKVSSDSENVRQAAKETNETWSIFYKQKYYFFYH